MTSALLRLPLCAAGPGARATGLRLASGLALATATICSRAAELAPPIPVPAATAEAVAYLASSNAYWTAHEAAGIAVALIFLHDARGARLYARLGHLVRRHRHLGVLLFAAAFFSCVRLCTDTVDMFWERAHDRLVGVQSEAVGAWLLHQLPQSFIAVAAASVGAAVLYALLQRAPRRWWVVAAGASCTIVLILLAGEPLTQRHKPLGSSPIEERVARLAGRAGVPRDSIALEPCDPPTSCPDGHVVGWGPTRLMLLNEALLREHPPTWTLQTVAHESKHFALDDNLKAVAVLSALLLAAFAVLDRCGRMAVARWKTRFGFDELGHPASLPLLALLSSVLYLCVLPPLNAFRQHVEFEADRFGLELNHDNEALARIVSSWTTASNQRVPEPNGFFMTFRSSHPSDGQRIRFANAYHPWRDGAPLEYGARFSPADGTP